MSDNRLAIKLGNALRKLKSLQRKEGHVASQDNSIPEKILQEKRIRLYRKKAKTKEHLQRISATIATQQ